MIYVDPFMYLKEMQDLNLLPAEVPSVLVACTCRTLHNLNLTRHNYSAQAKGRGPSLKMLLYFFFFFFCRVELLIGSRPHDTFFVV